MFSPSDGTYRAWHLTGAGFEELRSQRLSRPKIAPDELLLHQRVVTICYSSIKVLRLGNRHPRLVGRDLAADPVVLGDECFGVVAEVGEKLRDRYSVGDHVVVCPDLDVDAYGYGVPGGLQQLNVIRGKMVDFLIKVTPAVVERYGMFALALSEPLGCVERALSLDYRTSPKAAGKAVRWDDLGGQVPVNTPEAPSIDDFIVESSDPEVIERAVSWATPRLARFGVLAILGAPPADCHVSTTRSPATPRSGCLKGVRCSS